MPTRSLIRHPTLAPSHYAYPIMLTTHYAYHSSCLPHKSITRVFGRTLGYVKTEVRSIIRTSTRSILIHTHGRFLSSDWILMVQYLRYPHAMYQSTFLLDDKTLDHAVVTNVLLASDPIGRLAR